MSIGIALAGGGLKGVAHIGAIKALQELGLEIDYITGTSSGAMMAALYALGYTPEEMKQITKESYKEIIKFRKRVFIKAGIKFLISRKIEVQGIIEGERIEKIVEKYARQKEIHKMSDIQKKFAMITVDAKSTKKVVLTSTNDINKEKDVEYLSNIPIGKAVHASMSFPAIFTPCKYEKYCFIDGGTVDNLPVDTLKSLGATKTIAISFELDEFKGTENLFSTILRACDIFSMKDVKNGQDISDVTIKINANEVKLLQIDDVDKTIEIGYNAIMENKEKILGMVEKVK